jgi:hypothetical protein
MKIASLPIVISAVVLAFLGSRAISAQDKYDLRVPNGLAFSEFKGYEAWQVIASSNDGPLMAAILGNPVMIDAYLDGTSGQRETLPGWRHDGEDSLDAEKDGDIPGGDGAGYSA